MTEELCPEVKCCKIPVCLEFVGVSATDGFKEQMAELFSGIFADLCGGVDSRVAMCIDGSTVYVDSSTCAAILSSGGTSGACEIAVLDPEVL